MFWVIAIIFALIGAGTSFGVVMYTKKGASTGGSSKVEGYLGKIKKVEERFKSISGGLEALVSRHQIEFVAQQLDEARAALAAQRDILKEVESKLEFSQKEVEEREAKQQELKSAKEEDELKLQDLMSAFEALSNESMALEQRLAASLKNLDAMMEGLALTEEQKAVVTDLAQLLEVAGAQIRDLIMEYQSINERLLGLQQQHTDLEDEYTKLVEQQLGG